MALAHSTMSLFGFLATTALGIGLTFLVKKKIGTYITAFGIVGSLGMGVIKLIDHLCCKKRESPKATDFFDPWDHDPQTLSKGGSVYQQYLDSDSDDKSIYRQGSFREVPLTDPVPDEPEGNIQAAKATVIHNQGVLARMGAALSSMISSKGPTKEKEV